MSAYIAGAAVANADDEILAVIELEHDEDSHPSSHPSTRESFISSNDEFVIGSGSDCSFTVDSRRISKRQAVLRLDGGGKFVIENVDPIMATMKINGVQVTGNDPVSIKFGDSVSFGSDGPCFKLVPVNEKRNSSRLNKTPGNLLMPKPSAPRSVRFTEKSPSVHMLTPVAGTKSVKEHRRTPVSGALASTSSATKGSTIRNLRLTPNKGSNKVIPGSSRIKSATSSNSVKAPLSKRQTPVRVGLAGVTPPSRLASKTKLSAVSSGLEKWASLSNIPSVSKTQPRALKPSKIPVLVSKSATRLNIGSASSNRKATRPQLTPLVQRKKPVTPSTGKTSFGMAPPSPSDLSLANVSEWVHTDDDDDDEVLRLDGTPLPTQFVDQKEEEGVKTLHDFAPELLVERSSTKKVSNASLITAELSPKRTDRKNVGKSPKNLEPASISPRNINLSPPHLQWPTTDDALTKMSGRASRSRVSPAKSPIHPIEEKFVSPTRGSRSSIISPVPSTPLQSPPRVEPSVSARRRSSFRPAEEHENPAVVTSPPSTARSASNTVKTPLNVTSPPSTARSASTKKTPLTVTSPPAVAKSGAKAFRSPPPSASQVRKSALKALRSRTTPRRLLAEQPTLEVPSLPTSPLVHRVSDRTISSAAIPKPAVTPIDPKKIRASLAFDNEPGSLRRRMFKKKGPLPSEAMVKVASTSMLLNDSANAETVPTVNSPKFAEIKPKKSTRISIGDPVKKGDVLPTMRRMFATPKVVDHHAMLSPPLKAVRRVFAKDTEPSTSMATPPRRLMRQVFNAKPEVESLISPRGITKMFSRKPKPAVALKPKVGRLPKSPVEALVSPVGMRRMFADKTQVRARQPLINEPIVSPVGMKKLFAEKKRKFSVMATPELANLYPEPSSSNRKKARFAEPLVLATPARVRELKEQELEAFTGLRRSPRFARQLRNKTPIETEPTTAHTSPRVGRGGRRAQPVVNEAAAEEHAPEAPVVSASSEVPAVPKRGGRARKNAEEPLVGEAAPEEPIEPAAVEVPAPPVRPARRGKGNVNVPAAVVEEPKEAELTENVNPVRRGRKAANENVVEVVAIAPSVQSSNEDNENVTVKQPAKRGRKAATVEKPVEEVASVSAVVEPSNGRGRRGQTKTVEAPRPLSPVQPRARGQIDDESVEEELPTKVTRRGARKQETVVEEAQVPSDAAAGGRRRKRGAAANTDENVDQEQVEVEVKGRKRRQVDAPVEKEASPVKTRNTRNAVRAPSPAAPTTIVAEEEAGPRRGGRRRK